ncbi:MAG: transporter [Aquificae bacterium]|nr:transporter [Aquificota bacterium]
MKKTVLTSIITIFAVSSSFGAAYKIPEQSTRSMALSGAYVAGADSADASYFNPANMSWLNTNLNLEVGFKYIYLPPIRFEGIGLDPITLDPIISKAQTRTEEFYIPYFHYVSPQVGRFRFGLSLTTPAGLSKRWQTDPQKFTAEEFTLKVAELNPTVSLKLTSKLSIGGGIRFIYAEGIAKYQHPTAYKVDMDGDTFEYGYNLAISYKPDEEFTLSATYRSKVDLNLDGNAEGHLFGTPFIVNGKVQIPLPSALNLGIAYLYKKKTKFEFVFERTFWSAYKTLDFDFDNPALESTLGKPKKRDWDDTNTLRFGITHSLSEKLDVMVGYAIDETPIPELTLGFELPDSFGQIFSFGFLVHPTKNLELGFAFLYVKKDDRYIDYINLNGIQGRFSNLKAKLINLSLGYKF